MIRSFEIVKYSQIVGHICNQDRQENVDNNEEQVEAHTLHMQGAA